jgi:hypothetical protein
MERTMMKWICGGIFLLGFVGLWFLPDIARQKSDQILNEKIDCFELNEIPLDQLPKHFPLPSSLPLRVDHLSGKPSLSTKVADETKREILLHLMMLSNTVCDIYGSHLCIRDRQEPPGWGVLERLDVESDQWGRMGIFRRKLAFYGIWTATPREVILSGP